VKYLCLVYGDAGGATTLRPASTATTVRVRNGRTEVADGPFADSGEALRGYFVLECADMDEALARVTRSVEAGAVEVRPQYVEESA
jgi:hypothetical protein